MPLTYDPKDANNCWPEADYDAEITQVLDKVSKSSGNPMQEIKLRIYSDDGGKKILSDYITVPSGLFKLKQIAKALGKGDEFEGGQFQLDDHEGAMLKVHLVVEPSDEFGDQNKVKKYLAPQAAAPTPTRAPAGGMKQQIRDRQPRQTAPPFDEGQKFKEADIPF